MSLRIKTGLAAGLITAAFCVAGCSEETGAGGTGDVQADAEEAAAMGKEAATDSLAEGQNNISVQILNMREWSAWIDLEPGGDPRLYVQGEVELGTPGYEVTLARMVPQGFNPAILMLDLKIAAKGGMWPQVVTWHEAAYDEPAEQSQFTEVTVFYNGEIVQSLPVTEAQ